MTGPEWHRQRLRSWRVSRSLLRRGEVNSPRIGALSWKRIELERSLDVKLAAAQQRVVDTWQSIFQRKERTH